jgi:hypothetical protein
MEDNIMLTERLVKWNKEALEFWQQQKKKNVVLNVVISVGSVSQTGEGFEELVNTINSQDIKSKVKKVIITDTTYLYRHSIPEFSYYRDQKFQTPWYVNNKTTISKLEINTELKSWVNEINTENFKQWYKKIMQNYSGDEKWKEIDEDYKKLVDENALGSSSRGNGSFEQCRDFILEECAHLCAMLKNTVIAYPMPFYSSMRYLIEKYKLNITHLVYKLSRFSRNINSVSKIRMQYCQS